MRLETYTFILTETHSKLPFFCYVLKQLSLIYRHRKECRKNISLVCLHRKMLFNHTLFTMINWIVTADLYLVIYWISDGHIVMWYNSKLRPTICSFHATFDKYRYRKLFCHSVVELQHFEYLHVSWLYRPDRRGVEKMQFSWIIQAVLEHTIINVCLIISCSTSHSFYSIFTVTVSTALTYLGPDVAGLNPVKNILGRSRHANTVVINKRDESNCKINEFETKTMGKTEGKSQRICL